MRQLFLALAEFSGKWNAVFHARSGGRARIGVVGLAFALALGSGSVAGAEMLTLDLTVEFSGGQWPMGAPPYLTATFEDVTDGDVRLTLSTSGLVDAESVNGWYFNFDPALDPTQLTFTLDNADAVPNAILTGVNAFQADGDGKYDIRFDFPTGDEAARFTAGEEVVYVLSYISDIDVWAFDFDSVESSGNGTFQSAAHVTRIGPESNSGWIGATPEPSTALLLGVGLAGLAAGRERSRPRGRRVRRGRGLARA